MAVGFRLSPDVAGCPPIETPPDDYLNPFREDSNEALWIRQCFTGFKYFGSARHDLVVYPPPIIGSTAVPVTPWGTAIENISKGVKAGKYRNVTVTNDTESALGILVALDLVCDITARADNRVYVGIQSRFNGVHHSWTVASTPQFTATTKHVRRTITISANPHDLGFEDDTTDPAATLVVQPGDTAVVTAKLHVFYGDSNIPSGTETLNVSNSAVRVYGYFL